MRLRALLFLFIAASAARAESPSLGSPPVPGTAARDLPAAFKLPPLREGPKSEISVQVDKLQLGRRARDLKLNARSAIEAWAAADATLATARARVQASPPANARTFSGSRASELNAMLREPGAVRVASPQIEVDEPVLVVRAGAWLDLGRAELRAASPGPRFLLRVERGADGATVEGGFFAAGQWGALVSGARDVTVRDGRFADLRGGGVVLTGAPGAVLGHARLERIGGAPVVLHGEATGATVLSCEIAGNTGSSNWHAGIVVTDRNVSLADDPRALLNADGHGAIEQPIQTRLRGPRRAVIAFNRIALNRSSGFYGDGVIEAVIFDNLIEGNSKEGVCLDNGSTANVLAMNVIRLNGRRWGKTDGDLALDFVGALGRLPDGSSPAKTPGVSLDNALHNVVYANQIDGNYGGGIKMVRTAFFNLVGLNVLTDNNAGANPRFHFFGIELGSASADVPVTDLDFTPCRGNVVFGNAIRGSHYAGIFLGAGSTENDLFDNAVFGATNWALEQARAQPNPSLNNLTNIPSRNIDPGLDAGLLKATKGRFD